MEILQALTPITLGILAILALLSVLSLTVAIFKTVQFARLGVGNDTRPETALRLWLNGDRQSAVGITQAGDCVRSRVLQTAFSAQIANPDHPDHAEELARQRAILELVTMSSRLRILEVVVQAAPMLGLLGTVIGMIEAFQVLTTTEDAASPRLLARGIWSALTTTAFGLAVAIFVFGCLSWLESRIDRERSLIEAAISAAIYGRVE